MASASSPPPSDDYEPSSSDEDGDDHRPNRWDGPPSTWQDMNSQEIANSVALEETRNGDLAVHLYNAFALKRQGGVGRAPVPELDVNAQTGEAIRAAQWKPHSGWSAWPMPAATVPPDEFMKRAEDYNDGFTVRRPVTGAEGAPSFALEEVVSATALRFAKDKFQARPWQEDEDMVLNAPDDTDGKEDDHAALDESDSDGVSRSRPGSSKSASLKKEEPLDSDLDSSASDGGSSSVPPGPHYFKPIVSADDALSYDLLRPSARHILSKLDATLMVLHKSRNAAVNYASESESDSTVASDATTKSSQQGKRARGRPAKAAAALAMRLKRAQSKEADAAVSSQTEDPGTTSRGEEDTNKEDEAQPKKIKRGRPKKEYPRLQGETEKQYKIRVARLRKEPRPVFSDDSETGIEPQSDASELKPKRRSIARRKASASRDPSSDRSSVIGRKRKRHNLRDWRDVLGAAAVVGFSQPALDRAARRCADLFGQSLELRTMEEDPAMPDKVLQYAPGMELPDTARLLHQESEDEEEKPDDDRRRRARSTSVVSEDSRAPLRNASQNGERGGSVSSTGGGGQFFCTVDSCPRHTEGFARNTNLVRHMRLIHSLGKDGKLPLDVDSEDEMMGAVHVDGFLRPIKARRGWRGEGNRATTASPGKKGRGRPRKRGRPKSSDIALSDSSMDGL
ncbi:hypothetical protein PG987_014879 [Apiospora arundinis]